MARWNGMLLAAAMLAAGGAQADTIYLNQTVPLPEGAVITQYPAGQVSFLLQDAVGAWDDTSNLGPFYIYPQSDPVTGAYGARRNSDFLPSTTPGVFSGGLGCSFDFGPCVGATRITYTLPYQIIAMGGDLAWNAWPNPLQFFGVSEFVDYGPGPLHWARTFDTPTDTLTLAGLWSVESYQRWTLSNAWVVLAPAVVPEPGSLALFCFGVLTMAGVVRRRGC